MKRYALFFVFLSAILSWMGAANAWTPLAVDEDPLIRMPGTQPSILQNIASPSAEVQGGTVPQSACINCHKGDPTAPSEQGIPFFQWQGSMMAQAARDPIFWATMTVAAQDSIWVVGRPNATDICLRCHFPEGWMGNRSDELNASAMTGSDYDGIHCAVCHRMYDPFAKTTNDGTREGGLDQATYWDEATILSSTEGDTTAAADAALAGSLTYMNGNLLYSNDAPIEVGYTENGSGQMFIDLDSSPWANMRGPFADPETEAHGASNPFRYSRYHKSKFFCSTCHDVSNPVLANSGDIPVVDSLLSEQQAAHTYAHVERTFSEFMSSAYGRNIGTPTNQEFQDQGGAATASSCQDCHMPDILEVTAASDSGVVRPSDSTEHPNTGVPSHDLMGGNIWITRILASLDESLGGDYDTTNALLLNQGADSLTLDLTQGINPGADSYGESLLASAERARIQLLRAATIKNLTYDSSVGALSFRLQNNTGHKLLTGYPEGRRIYINVQAYSNENLVYEINPYDSQAGTFKGGLSFWNYNGYSGQGGTIVPDPAALSINEVFSDELVYEAVTSSTLTGEDHTFHFALATDRFKDNRIPPKGFDLSEAKIRLSEPVSSGGSKDDTTTPETNLYSAAEYAGGYDDVSITIPLEAIIQNITHVRVTLYYQGTSREYIEFLRDEINETGSNRALFGPDNILEGQNLTYAQSQGLNPDNDDAYLIQTDPFFTGLKDWGSTIWELWAHNHGLDNSAASVPGIVPFEMASANVAAMGIISNKMNVALMAAILITADKGND